MCCLIQEEPYSENPLHQVATLLLGDLTNDMAANNNGNPPLDITAVIFALYLVVLVLHPFAALTLNRTLCFGVQKIHDVTLKVRGCLLET